MSDKKFEVRVDNTKTWTAVSESAEYDAIHAVAGALLAGADRVEVSRVEDDG